LIALIVFLVSAYSLTIVHALGISPWPPVAPVVA